VSATTLRRRIPAQSGTAFSMQAGDVLRITDPQGEQVSDLFACAADDVDEWLSSGRTIDYEATIALSTGNTLWSNRSRPMLRIEADTVGRHDFLLAPCSVEMFHILHGVRGEHPSCHDNLRRSLAPFGVPADRIATTFNAFMRVEVAQDGRVAVLPPLSRAGDHIDLRAAIPLVVGVTACSAELSNNGSFSPIDVEVTRDR
jgi:uncharacterized protein